MYYIGFLSIDLNKMMLFWSDGKPTRQKFPYFGKVVGPYGSEKDARNTMTVVKKAYGYKENPIKGLVTKDGIRKVIALSRRIVKLYGKVRRKNPGEEYHTRKFTQYMRDLEKYKIGSRPYIETLAKAYEQLESARDSVKEYVRS